MTNTTPVYLSKQEEAKIKKNLAQRKYREKIKHILGIRNKVYYNEKCKIIREKKKEHYRENCDLTKEKRKDHYRENCEIVREKRKEHYSVNCETVREKRKEHYSENSDIVREKRKEHYSEKKRKKSEPQPTPLSTNFGTYMSNNSNNISAAEKVSLNSGDNSTNSCSNKFPEQVNPENLKEFINEIKESFARSNRSVNPKSGKFEGDNWQQSCICVVCDCLIIGTEEVKALKKENIADSADRLSVSSYEEYYCMYLNRILVEQYQVEDTDLHGLLLSPRAKYNKQTKEYTCCSPCYHSIVRGNKEERSSPPKFSIANGFAIGYIPKRIKKNQKGPNGETLLWEINPEKHLTDLVCAAISTNRPFGYVFSYVGGAQKSIKGHFSIFGVDQSHVGGVLNMYNNMGNTNKNIFVVLCGRMTPQQKGIVRRQAEMNTEFFLDLLTWFVKESGHPAYKDVIPPQECPNPIAIIQDEDKQNNTDESQDPSIECRIEGKTYYFSNADQRPSSELSVYDHNQQFLHAMLDNNAPVMLMYGGSYLKSHEINLEDAFPIQFPFGTGGPDPGKSRKVPVSVEECLRHYCRLSLKQFMRPDFILVCYHILCRNASFRTGVIKCKSNYQGQSLSEKISQLSVQDIKEASVALSNQGENGTPNNFAGSFLKSITTMCRVMGHTKEAAVEARKKVYAMTDRFGAHSIFFTVTPDDECTFRVRMFAAQGECIKIPEVNCDESECILDFGYRSKDRINYPGACSIYYQHVMQYVYKLLGWDQKNQKSSGNGIFGEVEAIFQADEEQGRNTLHAHFLIWIKNFSRIRDALFHPDPEIQETAREDLKNYVDYVFCSDYDYDQNLPVIHEECDKCLPVCELFEEIDDKQEMRDARNKNFCDDIEGKILRCKFCSGKVSTSDIFDSTLNAYKKKNNEEMTDRNIGEDDGPFPPSRYRRDIMTYRYFIDSLSPDTDDFYFNEHVRFHTATHRMNEHDWKHRPGCFKHGCECRFCFPKIGYSRSAFIVDDSDPEKGTLWRYLDTDKPSNIVYPFTIESKRSVGSQYLNTHSKTITKVIGCNSNIQLGSPRCVFYVVHYSTKSTQKEDRGADYDRIGSQVINRMRREKLRIERDLALKADDKNIEKNNNNNTNSNTNSNTDSNEKEKYVFKEALVKFLIGMSTHLSQDVISSTMAHLLISKKGSRFTFSHEFKNLLAGQMLNFLLGKDPGDFVLRRRNKGTEGELYIWADYSINDYIYRPKDLEDSCFYLFCALYEKIPFSFDRMKQLNENGLPILKEGEMYFEDDHPGQRYCYLKKSNKESIPLVFTPSDAICDIEHLELENNLEDVSQNASIARLEYAQIALILFFPFRGCELFELSNSDANLWEKFIRLQKPSNNSRFQFWEQGKKILQNMQDTHESKKCRLPADVLESSTQLKMSTDLSKQDKSKKKKDDDDEDKEFDNALDPSEIFLDEFTNFEIDSYVDNTVERNLSDLQRGMRFFDDRVFESRVQHKSIFEIDSTDGEHISEECEQNNLSLNGLEYNQESKFKTLLGFVSGSTICNFTEEEKNDIGDTSHQEYGYELRDDFLFDSDWNHLGFTSNSDRRNIPTMLGVAKKIAEEKKIFLDSIQYIAYEIICSTFLLGVINEGLEEDVSVSDFAITEEEFQDPETQRISEKIIKKLTEIGAKEQLVMFITGPAGAGKSTAIIVAQSFCFEFCKAVGINWDDNTFLFTALTGCAASLFGGMTIHSAAHLQKKQNKFNDAITSPWKGVKILIVDEVSMATQELMNKLSHHMNLFKRATASKKKVIKPNMVFGGYNVIFSGDFRQIPPVGAKVNELLYKNCGLWENAVNVAIMLTNSHRFKDDPEYGEMLLRMWKGTFTQSDCDRINERMLGFDQKLPSIKEDSDIAYACAVNLERVGLHAALFKKHIENFPMVESSELPPEDTVIIEANITNAPKRRPRKNNKREEDNDKIQHVEMTDGLRNLIYARLGDCQLKDQKKMIDPALKIYKGCHCMINDNDDIKEGRANGTVCRVVSVKRKNKSPLQWKNYNGRKVFTMNVKDVQYIEFEHFPKTKEQKDLEEELKDIESNTNHLLQEDILMKKKRLEILYKKRRFKLFPKKFYCLFYPSDMKKKTLLEMNIPKKDQETCKCTVEQFPVNLNDATTGHKLQGISKDELIVQSWSYRTSGWPYTVVSRVRKFLGLYLNERLDYRKYKKSYMESERDIKAFDERMLTKMPQKAREIFENC